MADAITETGELKIGYKGKLFKTPQCKYQFAATYPEGEDEESTKLLRAAYDKLWRKEFEKLKSKKAKDIKVAMEKTEKEISKKDKTEKELETFIDTANKMIKQGIENWRLYEVPRLAQELAEKAYDYVAKKLKRFVAKKKVKTALKIVALVLIVLAVAAATIALSVATMGAGTAALIGVIAGAIITAGGAAYKSYQAISKETKKYEGYLDKVEADLKKIDEAYAYQLKKEAKVLKGGKLGPKEKLKLMVGSVGPHVKSLKKHMDEAAKFNVLLKQKVKEATQKMTEAEEELAKVKEQDAGSTGKELAAAKHARYQAGRGLEKLEEKLGKFEELKKTVNTIVAEYEKKGDWAGSQKASGLMRVVQNNQEFVSEVGSGLATLLKLGKKLSSA